MTELDVFKAIRDGCTTRHAIIKHLQSQGSMHPNIRRLVDRSLHSLRKQRRIVECTKKRHGCTGWHLKEPSKFRKQCKKCPWKVSTNPRDIPNGYCERAHANLSRTIAEPGNPNTLGSITIMACHETPIEHQLPCVGWLDNQLNEGNNVALRLAVIQGQISADYELDGPQHERFEDTLPDG